MVYLGLARSRKGLLRERLSGIYWDLVSRLGDKATVSLGKDHIVIRANDPYWVWDFLESYCGDPVIIHAYRSGNEYNVRLYCLSKSVYMEYIVEGHIRLFYLDPYLALFKDEVFITA